MTMLAVVAYPLIKVLLTDKWIEYDQVKWELEEPIKSLVKKLKKDYTNIVSNDVL